MSVTRPVNRFRTGWRRWGKVFIIYIDHDEVGRMRFGRLYVTLVQRRDENGVAGVSSLSNEEPLMVMKAGIDIVR